MLEFWILKSPLNTMRGTPARHRAAFCWLQHRICRGLLLLGWNKRNLLISNPVRRPLILPKWQRIHSSQPSRWRVKAWTGFHFHIRLQHNRRTKKEGSIKAQNRNISYTAFQYRSSHMQQMFTLHCYTSHESTKRKRIPSLWDSVKKICS